MYHTHGNEYPATTEITAKKTRTQAVLISAPFLVCIGLMGSLPWVA